MSLSTHPAVGRPGSDRPTRGRRLAGALQRHGLFIALLAVGILLRMAAWHADYPALAFFGDSYAYLNDARRLQPGAFHPLGYPVFLRLVDAHGAALVTVTQHVLGIMSAAVMYALLRRLGTRPWLATLGVAGLLLDAYQVNIEQFVMAETLVEALTVLAMAALLWREPPTVALSAVAGLLLATAVLTRTVSIVMILPALALALGRRWGLRRCIALCSFALLPLAAYATWFHHVHGRFALESFGGRLLYGRVQAYLPCDRASLPPEEQPLCVPPVPLTGPTATDPAAGGGLLYFAWNQNSPIWQLRPTGGRTVNDIAQRYALRQIVRHPMAYARSLGASLLQIFAPTRATRAGEWPIQSWQFLPRTDPPRWHVAVLPVVPDRLTMPNVARLPATHARPPVGLLHHYQRWAYVPGPALAAAVATALLAWLRTRRGEGRLRWAMGTLAAAGGLLLLLPVATSGVDFRYLLPALTVLPPAAALAGELLLRQGRPVHRGI